MLRKSNGLLHDGSQAINDLEIARIDLCRPLEALSRMVHFALRVQNVTKAVMRPDKVAFHCNRLPTALCSDALAPFVLALSPSATFIAE